MHNEENVNTEIVPTWRAGYRYYPLGLAMRDRFGESVWKVSVDAGFTCPNLDGTVSRAGCVFCNARSFSPSRQKEFSSILAQIEYGITQLKRRYRATKFLAYFQPSTNTHAPPAQLEAAYCEALAHPAIVGLIIGTRPDALGEEVLDLLEKIAARTFVQVDVGLQTIHDESLRWLRRGHCAADFFAAATRLNRRQIFWGAHLILGIPHETPEMICATADALAQLSPHAVKLHHLYVVRDTPLATQWKNGEVPLLSLEEYASIAVDVIERLPSQTIIERVSGEASAEWLLAPAWSSVKHAARNAIAAEFARRNSWQGYNS